MNSTVVQHDSTDYCFKHMVHSEQHVRQCVASAYCLSDAVKALGFANNGSGNRKIHQLLKAYQIDVSHFDRGQKQRVHNKISKICPVCGYKFQTNESSRQKIVCSRKCANTYFRSGDNNGMRIKKLEQLRTGEIELSYAEICWSHHEKCCIVCSEILIVEAHHHNGDHEDNRPENFAPLCPTHHQYWHSKHRHLIQKVVDEYVTRFTSRCSTAW